KSEALAAAAETTATPTATTSASTTTRFLRPSFIHDQAATINALAVERGNGGLRLLVGAHLDEAETFGTPGGAVRDYLRRVDGAVGRKHLFEIVLADVVAQIAYRKLFAQWNSPKV